MDITEKAKPIALTFGDKRYILTYTKGSIRKMEENGFIYSDLDTKPITMVPMFVHGAFFARNPFVSEEAALDMFAAVPNKEDFLVRLSALYAEAVNSLYEPSTETEGNVSWE